MEKEFPLLPVQLLLFFARLLITFLFLTSSMAHLKMNKNSEYLAVKLCSWEEMKKYLQSFQMEAQREERLK